MKSLRKIAATMIALLFLFISPLSAIGMASQPIKGTINSAHAAYQWLRNSVPTPTLGDEEAVLAVLRGIYELPTGDYVQGYLQRLNKHYLDGGLQDQSLEVGARHALVLAACGVPVEDVAPGLLSALCNIDAAKSEGMAAQQAILLLYGAGGERLEKQAQADIPALLSAYLSHQNADGGFGLEGTPDALSTAKAVQALALHSSAAGVAEPLQNAQVWLQLRTNDVGGFDLGAQASPIATANAILAAATLGEDPSYLSPESASLLSALLIFQNENGGFFANPDTEPDKSNTSAGLLALVAQMRYAEKSYAIFNFEDAGESSLKPAPTASGAGNIPFLPDANGKNNNSWLAIILLIVIALLLAALLIIVLRRGKAKPKALPEAPEKKEPIRTRTATRKSSSLPERKPEPKPERKPEPKPERRREPRLVLESVPIEESEFDFVEKAQEEPAKVQTPAPEEPKELPQKVTPKALPIEIATAPTKTAQPRRRAPAPKKAEPSEDFVKKIQEAAHNSQLEEAPEVATAPAPSAAPTTRGKKKNKYTSFK